VSREYRRKRIKGFDLIGEVIEGVVFKDGVGQRISQTETPLETPYTRFDNNSRLATSRRKNK